MSQFKVYQDYSLDATLVSNVFIDKYMADANDAQLKIYLYLLRVLSAHKICSISDLADQFNYTEKDVSRALKYWEKHNLIALDYDEDKNLTGVRLLDFSATTGTIALAPVVPMPLKSESKVEINPAPKKESFPENSEELSKITSKYSTDDILSYKDRESTSELIFVVEQYLGKTLSPSNIKSLIYFQDELGFSTELIDYLFEYCVGQGKRDFRYIEKVALSWHSEGITTPKMAAKASRKYDKKVYDIMKFLGRTSSPTDLEVEFILRWTKEYDFALDIIQEACNRTVMATDSHRFEYADKILLNWYNSGVHHLADIEAVDASFNSRKTSYKSKGAVPQYKQFTHQDSGYTDLEKELLSN